MADKEINIVLRLYDNFTATADKVQGSVEKIGRSIDLSGRQIERFGSKMAFVGGATTGAFLVAMNNVQNASIPLQRTFAEMDNVLRNFQLSIANSVEPAFQKLVNVLASLTDAWNNLSPTSRDAILQFTFLGGAALTAGGAIVKLLGAIVTITGKIIELVSLALTPMGAAVLAISFGVLEMVKHWDQVRQYVLPVITALDTALTMAYIGFLKLQNITGQFIPVVRDQLAKGLQDAQKHLEDIANGAGLSKFVDEGVGKIQNLQTAFQQLAANIQSSMEKSTQRSKEVVLNWAGLMKDTAQKVANAMSQSLGNFFYNTLTGQIHSAKQAFIEFGNSILRILSDVLAKVLLQKAFGSILGAIIPGGSFFHSGGQIRKAHSGMLNDGEVPIIAQEGEGILSRQGMAQIGGNNLRAMNRGESPSKTETRPIYIIIQAWDASDIRRNAKTIEGIIDNALRTNSNLRDTIKRFG